MVTKNKAKTLMKNVVKRYSFVEENSDLIKKNLLSEQDIPTKFILPMLEALNWDIYEILTEGPLVHEKGFRERDIDGTPQEKAKHGLPDFSLRCDYSSVPFFVEVKQPKITLNPSVHL